MFLRKYNKIVRRCIFWFLLSYSAFQVYKWVISEYDNPGSLNYFLDKTGNDGNELEYVIETPSCKILKFSPWEKQILPFIKPKTKPLDCAGGNKQWIYLKDKMLLINQTAMHESGYSLNSLRCCYKSILRVEQTLGNHDFSADNEVRRNVWVDDIKRLVLSNSEDCIKIEKPTPISNPFIRVFCTSTSWPFLGEVVYRDFFATAILPKSSNKKLDYWKEKIRSGQPIPPSIVMIGIDSISRMNFHRSFDKTNSYLKQIGAVELLGYTKVGENTLPNEVAFLTGLSFENLLKSCLRGPEIPQDFCPYLWKRFDAAKYLTATVEDAPGLVGFNYLKLGFVNQPTDFYFRPFMLAVHKSLPRKDYYHTDCIGRFTTEETLLNYIKEIMNYTSIAPVFIHSWMTSLAHLDINGAKFADGTISDFLKSVDLSNTILVFISDHGQRYGAIRETLAGWYEDKLPILSIYIPQSIQSKYPSWKESLLQNSKRLTSPFDLYYTMNQIVDEYTTTPPMPEEEDPNGEIIPRQYGQSLFSPVPLSRNCKDVGVRVNYCACLPPQKLNSTDSMVITAAEAAVAYLNRVVPSQCEKAKLDRIVASALMESDIEITYIVTFYTKPGDFMFEANVNYDTIGGFSVTTDLLRMNKIIRNADCVNTSILERYCYCK